MIANRPVTFVSLLLLLCQSRRRTTLGYSFTIANHPSAAHPIHSIIGPLHHSSQDDPGSQELPIDRIEISLSERFQHALVLQRSGDRSGALSAYQSFLQVAQSYNVDPSLYAEVYANMGAVYARQGTGDHISVECKQQLQTKAKSCFMEAVKYRPGLGSAWVNLALLLLAEGKMMDSGDPSQVETIVKEARSCCVRALGMDNEEERSRALANKLLGDIDAMMKQSKISE